MFGDDTCVDLDVARKYYKRSLKLLGDNFLTIIGYLRLLAEEYDHAEMIRVINRALELPENERMLTKLKIMKAYIIWIYNPQEINYPR